MEPQLPEKYNQRQDVKKTHSGFQIALKLPVGKIDSKWVEWKF